MAFSDILNVGQTQPPTLDVDILDSSERGEKVRHVSFCDGRAFIVNGNDYSRIALMCADSDCF